MTLAGARPSYRRRHWVVNRRLQFRFVGLLLACYVVLVIVTLAGMYGALWLTLYTFNLLQDPAYVSLFTTAGLILALELLLLAPPIICMGIWLTHKVAGPMVRICAVLERMARGHLGTRITLRKGDALIEVAEAINHLADSLQKP
jgi:methyl-accepting chemotaxis protein